MRYRFSLRQELQRMFRDLYPLMVRAFLIIPLTKMTIVIIRPWAICMARVPLNTVNCFA